MRVLEGSTVLELYPTAAVSFIGRYLADLGASVTIIEPPDGLSMRQRAPLSPSGESLLFAYLQHGKRSAVVDSAIAGHTAALREAMAGANLVLHGFTPEQFRKATGIFDLTGVAAVSITPFGEVGPRAGEAASELTIAASSGWLWFTRYPDGPPTLPYGHQPSYFAALGGVTAALTQLLHPSRPAWTAISIQAAMAGVLAGAIPQAGYAHTAHDPAAFGSSLQLADLYATSDGIVALCINTDLQWRGLCAAIGREEWQEEPRLATWAQRSESRELKVAVEEWCRDKTTAEAFAILQAFRLPAAMLQSPADLLSEEQIHARCALGKAELRSGEAILIPGLPFGCEAERRQEAPAAPPALGPALEPPGAPRRRASRARSTLSPDLRGVRVLDFTHVWAGPFCTRQLADLGADVIRIESPTHPDQVRLGKRVRKAPKESSSIEMVLFFQEYNRNKRSISLEVGKPEGRELFLRLVKASDVVVDNFSARVMPQLGLDFEQLAAVNPGIVQVRLTGWGLTGPLANCVAYGESLEAASGLVYLTRSLGRPLRVGVAYPDVVGGSHGSIAALAGLHYRARTGRGLRMDVSERDGTMRLIGEAMAEASLTGGNWLQESSAHPDWSPAGVYPCAAEGQWLSLACTSDSAWGSLTSLLGTPEQAQRPLEERREASAVINAAISAWTKKRTCGEAARLLREAGLEVEPVVGPVEFMNDPHVLGSHLMARVEHPLLGEIEFPGPPITRDGQPLPVRHAPLFGQDSDDILRDILGLSQLEIERLTEAGVVKGVPEIDW